MQIKADSPKEYLSKIPADRRKAIAKVRTVVKKNLPKGYKEQMLYGMISYVVPLKMFPEGYREDKKTPLWYASIGNQKNYMVVYLSNVYGDKKLLKWFQEEYKKTGKKLDMGSSCVRFKTLDDLPLDLIGKVISKTSPKDHIEVYKKSRQR